MTENRKSHGGSERCRNFRNLNLNETSSRWENHSHSASPRPTSFALASRQQSLAQTAPLARATNLRIKANRVPPRGFVQKPVPERPRRLALKPSSAPALRVQASSLSRRQSREDRSVAGYRRDLKQGSGNIHESTRAAREFPKDARMARRSYRGRIYAFSGTSPGKSGPC